VGARVFVDLPAFFLEFHRDKVDRQLAFTSHDGEFLSFRDGVGMKPAAKIVEGQALVRHRCENVAGVQPGALGGVNWA